MRIVGKERLFAATREASYENLVAADRFMSMMRGLVGGMRHFFPKGVYRYRDHDEADAALLDAVVRDMVELEKERHGSGKLLARRDA